MVDSEKPSFAIRSRRAALGTHSELVGKDGPVKAGDDLFRVTGDGPSSWHDFYDESVTYQIVVSLYSASGSDLDASSLVKVR